MATNKKDTKIGLQPTNTQEIIAESSTIQLTRQEAEHFVNVLENPPRASNKLTQLFAKHSVSSSK